MPSYTFDNNLVLWMPFTEGSGSGLVDISGNNNDGTLQNSPIWFKNSFMGGYTIEFNGSTQYVSVPADTSFNNVDSVTVLCWIRPDGTGFNGIIIGNLSGGASGNGYALQDYNGVIRSQIRSGASNYVLDGTTTLTADTWWFVAMTYESGGLQKVYVNGVEDNSQSAGGNIDNSGNNINIARDVNSGAAYFDGEVSQIMVFDKALSAEEIKDIYKKTYRA